LQAGVTTLPEPHPGITLAAFTHLVQTRANRVKFSHQALCIPKILTLIKAVRKGFLKGCPNLSKKLILKFLTPSPATAKSHMKQPHHGIKSTRPKPTALVPPQLPIVPPPMWLPLPEEFVPPAFPGHTLPCPNLIGDDFDESITNVFCFGAFVNQHSCIIYNDLMGNFPFVFFDGSVCFHVLYHYKANAILEMPIGGLDDISIFNAYKTNFNSLAQKGFKPKLDVMDNQATKYIKKFLTKEECKLQIVKPHNHHVNAVKCATQMFKDAFISALAMTNSDFSLQLWDRLTPQVINTLNMMQASRIDPTKSTHKVLYRMYDWNRCPLAPLGCKAVVYKDRDTIGLWA
jgi:hypothetical protein